MAAIAHLSGQERIDIDAAHYKTHVRSLTAPPQAAVQTLDRVAVYPSGLTQPACLFSAGTPLDQARDLQRGTPEAEATASGGPMDPVQHASGEVVGHVRRSDPARVQFVRSGGGVPVGGAGAEQLRCK